MRRALPLSLLLLAACGRPQKGVRVLFLSVGQGDCTVLASGNEALLVDAGPSAATAERTILRRLREEGVSRVAGLLLTHDDADHTGGAGALAAAFPAMRIFVGPASRVPDGPRVTRLGTSQRLGFGPYRLDILYPASDAADDNARSALIGVSASGAELALTGDSPAPTETEVATLLPNGAPLAKAGHHGSSRSTSAAFLARIRPRWLVVSAGAGNPYGHPAPSTLARAEGVGARVVRTDRDGDVVAYPDGRSWRVVARSGLRTR